MTAKLLIVVLATIFVAPAFAGPNSVLDNMARNNWGFEQPHVGTQLGGPNGINRNVQCVTRRDINGFLTTYCY